MGADLNTPIVGMPEGDDGVFRAVLDERHPCTAHLLLYVELEGVAER